MWQAITEEEFTVRYFHGSRGEIAKEPGGRYLGWSTDRTELWVEGEVVEYDPPRRLVHTGGPSTAPRRPTSRRAA